MTCPFPFWGKKRPPIFQGQQKICEFQGVYILEPAFVFRPLDAESRCVWFRLVSRYSRYNISQQSPRRQSNSCPDILLIVFVVQRKNEHKKNSKTNPKTTSTSISEFAVPQILPGIQDLCEQVHLTQFVNSEASRI